MAGVVFRRIGGRIVPIRQAAGAAIGAVARKTGLSLGHKVAQASRIEGAAAKAAMGAKRAQFSIKHAWSKDVLFSSSGQKALTNSYHAEGINNLRVKAMSGMAAKIMKLQSRNRRVAGGIAGATVAAGSGGGVAYMNRRRK